MLYKWAVATEVLISLTWPEGSVSLRLVFQSLFEPGFVAVPFISADFNI